MVWKRAPIIEMLCGRLYPVRDQEGMVLQITTRWQGYLTDVSNGVYRVSSAVYTLGVFSAHLRDYLLYVCFNGRVGRLCTLALCMKDVDPGPQLGEAGLKSGAAAATDQIALYCEL